MVKSEAKINDFLLHMSNALIYYNPDPSIKIELSEFRRRLTILTVCHFSLLSGGDKLYYGLVNSNSKMIYIIEKLYLLILIWSNKNLRCERQR